MHLSIKDLLHILFPERCVVCNNQLLYAEKTICVNCRHNLPLTGFSFEKDNTMERSFVGRLDIEAATALFFFYKKGNVQQLIHQLKYKGHQEIGKVTGAWLGMEMKESKRFDTVDIIVPVPLHPEKLKKRGYNQVSLFGMNLSKILHIPFDDGILKRNRFTETQTYKHRTDRFLNTEHIFEVKNLQKYKGKHLLLIDDVLTTGATLEACSLALKQIPDIKISIATIAYTP